MKTLAVLSRKGGTGKTTLAIHLAVAAERAGHTAILIDLDPQASAAKWSDRRASVCESQTEGNGFAHRQRNAQNPRLSANDHREGDTPFVVTAPASRLQEVLSRARDAGATLAILDTAPHTETAALDAANVAQMALIPCKPALIDLQAITSTINVIRLANVPARIVFNAVPARGDRALQAREAVKPFDVPCAPCDVGDRVAFSDSYNAGLTAQEYEPRGKASHEIQNLYKYISAEMGV